MIKADKKYSLKDVAPGVGRQTIYPYKTMHLGMSFQVENGGSQQIAFYANKTCKPKKFISRTMNDRTHRVFRIK